jgi:hypothetical protein
MEIRHRDPLVMNFDVIFLWPAYLRYPQIEGLGDELVLEGPRVQLTRKRKSTDPKASRLPLPEGKRSRVSSEVFPTKTNELSKQSNLQLSLLKETAFPQNQDTIKEKTR